MPFSSLSPPLQRALSELGLVSPTPIQAQAIPPLLGGRDLVGRARTGSGKTLAFLLPLLNRVDLQNRYPQGLVLCPTRELADQVAREARKAGRHLPGLKVTLLVGGEAVGPQLDSLRHGATVVVGTPGRVLDHLKRGTLPLQQLLTLVLDEADRMLEMGFQEEVESILRLAPPERQTALFSATFPEGIRSLQAFLRNAVVVETGEEASPDIHQTAHLVEAGDKQRALLQVLEETDPDSALVFCHQKATVSELALFLRREGVSAAALHGDLEQVERTKTMALFRNRSLKILVATDLAARGIDISGVDLVVNYDFPRPEIYTHRIGRTGRAGKRGRAASLLSPGEERKLRSLEEAGQRPELLPLPEQLLSRALSPAPMQTLYVGGGRKDKIRPGDLLGALTGAAGGLSGKDVGKIEIHDRFSYVAVAREVAHEAMGRLREGKIKGRKFRVELTRLQAQ